jgi:hypothetical protein
MAADPLLAPPRPASTFDWAQFACVAIDIEYQYQADSHDMRAAFRVVATARDLETLDDRTSYL